MSPRDATVKAMERSSGPVIAVGLVLSAVFVPCAFITGIIGQFFRQFALTIAVSTLISAFNSLTLSPALAALLLQAARARADGRRRCRGSPSSLAGGCLGYLFLTPYLAPYLGTIAAGRCVGGRTVGAARRGRSSGGSSGRC